MKVAGGGEEAVVAGLFPNGGAAVPEGDDSPLLGIGPGEDAGGEAGDGGLAF